MRGRTRICAAIEGIDGSGKSHVCRLIGEQASCLGWRVRIVDKHLLAFADDFAGRRMAELRRIIWPADPEPEEDRLGTEFYLFLLAAWFAGLRRAVTALADEADIVLLDGSFYRVIAKAHVRAGLDLEWLASLFEQAARPDLVVLLDVDPGLAWHRRTRFKATELGRWDGHVEDARHAFIGYQGEVRAVLAGLARRHDWVRIAQAPEEDAAAVAAAAWARIAARLKPARDG